MTFDPNPQAAQMADPSMLRNLDAQARAIWPQEAPLFDRYGLRAGARILDVGCGPGEIASRLAEKFPQARVTGVDLLEEHLRLARTRYPQLADRMALLKADAFSLPFEDETFDLAVCRHVVQAIPDAPRALAELARVTRPGGFLHVLAEDYGMIHLHPTRPDVTDFWNEGPPTFGRAQGVDLHVGRRTFTHLRKLGLQGVRVDWIVVDPVRVPRETFAAIFEAWRDGYAGPVAEATRFTDAHALFDGMIACLLDPDGYGVWHVPIVSGQVPAH
ncbi:MAG TPA: methyltransferase domain-containing protein [Candidatus Polarisedimenticolaceae bacterium]|nr:methyltransferase domain-containing protein [Candidatus Polarisedimenticolaceae bacterium]